MAKKNIVLTDRDFAALAELGELGLMDTDLLFDRHYSVKADGTPVKDSKSCRRRLGDIELHGWVESKSPTVIESVTPDGPRVPRKKPSIFRLTVAGADMVEQRLGVRPPRPGRSEMPGLETALHRLGVVKTRLVFDDAHRQEGRPVPTWIMEYDTYPDWKPKAKKHEQFILAETFRADGKSISCRPDASVLLQLPGDPPAQVALYLEYDRSTEGEDQITRKLAWYATLFHNRGPCRHWPDAVACFPRVAFLCPSLQRIENIARWGRNHPGMAYCRFAVHKDCTPNSVLRQPIWLDAALRPRALFRS